MNKKRFGLVGAAGYIAPRHMKAIKDTGGKLIAALDPHDSVGILDSYNPECRFFSEPERFDRYLEKLNYTGIPIDYLTVCSPNYLHDAHCRLGMRVGANIICEKPIVINPWNIDQLKEIESRYDKKINVILQLRLHNEIIKLKEKIDKSGDVRHEVHIKYITPRGLWYDSSWKNVKEKSGGLLMNIGVHLFDMLLWVFGKELEIETKIIDKKYCSGRLHLDKADIYWALSTDKIHLPEGYGGSFREIIVDGEEIVLDGSFTELHTEAYKRILSGKGFGLDEARGAIELIYKIRNAGITWGRDVL